MWPLSSGESNAIRLRHVWFRYVRASFLISKAALMAYWLFTMRIAWYHYGWSARCHIHYHAPGIGHFHALATLYAFSLRFRGASLLSDIYCYASRSLFTRATADFPRALSHYHYYSIANCAFRAVIELLEKVDVDESMIRDDIISACFELAPHTNAPFPLQVLHILLTFRFT